MSSPTVPPLCCSLTRGGAPRFKSPRLYKKIPDDYPRWVAVATHVAVWSLGLLFAFLLLGYGLSEDTSLSEGYLFLVLANAGWFCMANRHEFSFYLMWLPYTILLGICGLFLTCTIVTICLADYRIFRFQWRYIMYSAHFLLINVLLQIQIYVISPSWDPGADIQAHAQCVGGQPRDPDPHCPKPQLSDYWFLWVSRLLLFTGPIMIVAYVYWTSKRVQRWWKHVFLTGHMPEKGEGSSSTLQLEKSTADHGKQRMRL